MEAFYAAKDAEMGKEGFAAGLAEGDFLVADTDGVAVEAVDLQEIDKIAPVYPHKLAAAQDFFQVEQGVRHKDFPSPAKVQFTEITVCLYPMDILVQDQIVAVCPQTKKRSSKRISVGILFSSGKFPPDSGWIHFS